MKSRAPSDLRDIYFPNPSVWRSMRLVRRVIMPLRRNQQVAKCVRDEVIGFNAVNRENPIRLVTVKRSSFTRGDLVWGSDIDWLTFYGDCSERSRQRFLRGLTRRLRDDFGIFFVRSGEKDEHNHLYFYSTDQIADIEFDEFILTVFYDRGVFPGFTADQYFVGDPRHYPLDAQPKGIFDKVVARLKLFKAFGVIGDAEIRRFLSPQTSLQPYRLAYPELYELVEREVRQFLASSVLPRREAALYRSILLQLHFVHFGYRLGLVPRRTWFIPEDEEAAVRNALDYLARKGMVYLPFSGGILPKWDLSLPDFKEEGIQATEIGLFDADGGVVRWEPATQVENLPRAELRLRTLAGSERREDLFEIIANLPQNLPSLTWMAVEILLARNDDATIFALLDTVENCQAVVQQDDYKSFAKEDLVRINVLWILSQKETADLSGEALRRLQATFGRSGFLRGENYAYSARYARDIAARLS